MTTKPDKPEFHFTLVKPTLQQRLDNFLRMLNRKGFVSLEVIRAPKYPAGAQGFCVLNHAFGQVQVSEILTQSLTNEELDFVIVHELTHIVENHLIWRSLADLPQSFLDAATAAGDEDASLVNLLVYAAKAVCVVTKQLPPEAALTKAQEIGADVQAICLTRNLPAAISTLTKLAGNNLDQASHIWEFVGVGLPVMTIRERIDEIQRSIQQLNMYGFTPF